MIYLDNAATTPLSLPVKKAMIDAMDSHFGNPSSLHHLGVEAEKMMKVCRKSIARSLGATEHEVLFTSGGTEANNLAILGAVPGHGKKVITTAFEHKSVLECFHILEKQGYEVIYLKPDSSGCISVEALEKSIDMDVAMVSIMGINNETGAVQDIETLGKSIKSLVPKALFHVDWIQGFMKFPMDVARCKVDLLTVSAHKIYGPKGIGGLFVRKGVNLRPRQFGGGQERGLRPGTENFLGIIGFGEAVSTYQLNLEHMSMLNDRLYNGLREGYQGLVRVSPEKEVCSPVILNLSFPGLKAEVLLHMLESKGIYVSTGSACNSKVKTYSHVLNAMGLDEKIKMGAVRMSLDHSITTENIDDAIRIILECANDLRRMMR